jgi:hypothetical protein
VLEHSKLSLCFVLLFLRHLIHLFLDKDVDGCRNRFCIQLKT